jgi:hypothetical protein
VLSCSMVGLVLVCATKLLYFVGQSQARLRETFTGK